MIVSCGHTRASKGKEEQNEPTGNKTEPNEQGGLLRERARQDSIGDQRWLTHFQFFFDKAQRRIEDDATAAVKAEELVKDYLPSAQP